MRFFLISIFVIFYHLDFAQSQDSCGFVVIDQVTQKKLPFANVSLQNNLISSDSVGVFHINCAYSDSIWISLPGYIPFITKYNGKRKIIDTIYISPNTYTFSPIKIVGEKQKNRYKIGQRNRIWDLEWFIRRNCTLESFIPNNTHKRSKILKASLFLIDHNRGKNPNISIRFYKVKNGKPGKPITEDIKLEPKSFWKKTGWFHLEINNKINIPRNGFFVLIRKNKNTHNQVGIGFIQLKYTKGNTYFYCNSDRENKISLNKYLPYKHYGVKMYFEVK